MGIRGELFSQKVLLPNRTYFFNVKENRLGDLYLNIVESKNRDSGGFDRQSVILFADDLQEFLKGFDESLKVMEKAMREKKRGGDSDSHDEKRPAKRERSNAERGERSGAERGERSSAGRGERSRPERGERGRPERSERGGAGRGRPERSGAGRGRTERGSERSGAGRGRPERGERSGAGRGRPERGGERASAGRGRADRSERGGKRVVVKKRDRD